ncbi:MAG: tRNA dihydrouridine synthase DusB [Actinomycetota bacterium]
MKLVTSRFIVDPPVVLAPMAGITNQAFRRLCREYGAGLYVSEMVTSRALIERSPETIRMVTPDKDENIKSVQLYGVDPEIMAKAVELLIRENRADHIDLNMGCPVPKVTKKGGGAALPWKKDLFREILKSAVETSIKVTKELNLKTVPITVKMRMGIDEEHLTYIDAAKTAVEVGITWIALHARTAEQMYSGNASWIAIKKLVDELKGSNVPVLGNGDIWSAQDALRMIDETGCHGVVVGRGCLGRPWLFGQLSAAFQGKEIPKDPNLEEISQIIKRHATLLSELYGEYKGIRDIRKHMAWYLKGFSVGNQLRTSLAMVESLDQLDFLLEKLDKNQTFPEMVQDKPRGRAGSKKKVSLPHNWLNSRDLNLEQEKDLRFAELSVSGG